jgi:hypothetical protein
MAYPLKTDYKAGKGLAQISASDLTTLCNMLNGLQLAVSGTGDDPVECKRTNPDNTGNGWKFTIPMSGASPDTTGKTKYMVYQITDDTTTPPTAGWDWVRAHG